MQAPGLQHASMPSRPAPEVRSRVLSATSERASRAACRAVGARDNLIGGHSMVWVGNWTPDEAEKAIAGTKRHGFDLIEINMSQPELVDAAMTRDKLEKHGLQAAGSLGLNPGTDISSPSADSQKAGVALLKEALKKSAEIGMKYFVGVNYCSLEKYPAPCSPEQYKACVKNLKEASAVAADLGITWGVEVVNRYETNILNTAEQGMALVNEVNSPNVVVHLDTYHMNIEEKSMADAVAVCGDKLGYVHLGESHRGYLGQGSVDFEGLFRALAKSGYKGPMTFETFSSAVVNAALSNTLCVWRNLWSDCDNLAGSASKFMHDGWAKALAEVKLVEFK